MTKFGRIELRTTNVEAARSFYRSILGHDCAVLWQLHEQALARGAKPHWLGHLEVEDLERTAAAFVARGATPLGPTRPSHDGVPTAVLRDPGGAIVALSGFPAQPRAQEPRLQAVWHLLNTSDVARARANYCELFGWSLTTPIDVGAHGTFQQFAWQPGGESVGALGDIAQRPGVHPHWLFFFEVEAIESASTATRAAGGLALEPITLPNGARVCVCDDPQGAAFALLQRS
jgi:predicted enzyme related to lactoylglutathione lyase